MFSLSLRSRPGKPGSAATTLRFEKEESSVATCRFRPIVLGAVAPILERVKASVYPRPARNCCSLASSRIQALLDVALAASETCRQKMCRLESRELIFRMFVENPTSGAPRLQGELKMPGYDVPE
jgi:hypothetical protein